MGLALPLLFALDTRGIRWLDLVGAGNTPLVGRMFACLQRSGLVRAGKLSLSPLLEARPALQASSKQPVDTHLR